MTYSEFKDTIVSRIKEYLPKKYSDAMVSFNPVLKNNGLILDALHIRLKDSNVTPNIYLNHFYEQFKDGRSLEDILLEIARMQIENEDISDIDIAAFTDFKNAAHRIKAKLINAAQNADYLSNKPHTIVAKDLVAVYYIEFASCESGTMSAVITKPILDAYGITVGELHQIALNNMSDDAFFTGMGDLLSEFGLPEHADHLEETMFVLSNTSRMNGAAMVLNNKAMDSVIDRIGKDFYALPSSIHEWILVPKRLDISVPELAKMVREINETNVAPHERLSNHVYTYDPAHHELRLAV